MSCRPVDLLDARRQVIATACVDERDGRFIGRVELDRMPADLRATFEEYESIVNDQVFSLLDEIEDRIAVVPIKVRFADGREGGVADLQIFPSCGTISFLLAETSTLRGRP